MNFFHQNRLLPDLTLGPMVLWLVCNALKLLYFLSEILELTFVTLHLLGRRFVDTFFSPLAFYLVLRAQEFDGAAEQVLIIGLDVVGFHNSADFADHFSANLCFSEIGGEPLLLFYNRVIFVFYGVLAPPVLQYLYEHSPLLAFLLHLLEHYQILFERPLGFALAGVEMIEPAFATLLRSSEVLLIGGDEQGLRDFIPLRIFVLHDDAVQHVVLIFCPLGHFN